MTIRATLAFCALGLALGPAPQAAAQDSFGGAGTPQPQAQQPSQPQGQTQSPPPGYGTPPGYGSPPQAAADQLTLKEREDFGVPPTNKLHSGPMHGPTPASIPGGQVITTKGVMELMQSRQTPFFLFDVLGAPDIIPGALGAVPAHQPGTFDDKTQREFGGFLQQTTGGRMDTPLIFYCASRECWMSYNAALRAIHMGYTNVLWYRGGLDAWQAAGGQVQNIMPPQRGGPSP